MPHGQRLIGVVDGESDLGGPTLAYDMWWDALAGGFMGPWGDNSTAFVSARWLRWMAAYVRTLLDHAGTHTGLSAPCPHVCRADLVLTRTRHRVVIVYIRVGVRGMNAL